MWCPDLSCDWKLVGKMFRNTFSWVMWAFSKCVDLGLLKAQLLKAFHHYHASWKTIMVTRKVKYLPISSGLGSTGNGDKLTWWQFLGGSCLHDWYIIWENWQSHSFAALGVSFGKLWSRYFITIFLWLWAINYNEIGQLTDGESS